MSKKKRWHILIVDDQEENRYFLESLLKGMGFAISSASNGKEALEILEKGECNLIISDILMPIMDGYQLCMEVRFNEKFNEIPFIFYTATYTDPKDEEFALKLGADYFIRKPMEPQDFAKKLNEIMDEAIRNNFKAKKPELEKEEQIFKLYNERLVRKLNKKMQDLEREIAHRKEVEKELKKSEEKYRSLIEQASDGIFIMDFQFIILDVNTSACNMLHYDKEELIGKNFVDLIILKEGEEKLFHEEELFSGKTIIKEMPLFKKGKTPIFIEMSIKVINGENIQAIVRDITFRKKAEEALKESEERYALSVKGANDGLWDWNLQTNTLYLSPRWKEMLGYSESEIANTPEAWFYLVHPDDIEMLKTEIKAHLDGFKPHLEVEHRILHKNQTYRWVLARGLAIRDKDQKPTRMAGSLTDITERKKAEEQILHDAFHDSLTGLPNRALFEDRLSQACERAKRFPNFNFSVLYLNLDRFRLFNESLGHSLSDKLLTIVAQKIKANLKPGDTLARFGADEFLILLEDIKDASEASRIAQKIIEDIGQPINLEGSEIFLTASIGLVMSTEGIEKPEDYLRNSHIAMHKAKTKAKGSYVFFNEEMYQKAMENLKMESFLRKAIERKEFCVHYQPIFDLFTGALIGFEALVRWKHPERGILHPKDFLPVAEEAGFIHAIDQFVLSTSCLNFRKWLDVNAKVDKLFISVNFSSKEFSNPKLINKISQILKETGLDPSHLVIEITESTLMENIASAQNIFFHLQKLGVKLFLDDFGTGYSSLSYLHHFLIDTLKIDRAFVGQIKEKKEKNPIVQTIVSLAHNMNMQVLAEGVETELQYKKLKDLKCNCAQGYYFSYPVDSSVIEEKIIRSYLKN